jgi:hypothetical protein
MVRTDQDGQDDQDDQDDHVIQNFVVVFCGVFFVVSGQE